MAPAKRNPTAPKIRGQAMLNFASSVFSDDDEEEEGNLMDADDIAKTIADSEDEDVPSYAQSSRSRRANETSGVCSMDTQASSTLSRGSARGARGAPRARRPATRRRGGASSRSLMSEEEDDNDSNLSFDFRRKRGRPAF